MRSFLPRLARARWRARCAWDALTAEQKAFQRTKMAIHAAMITRMDLEIGKVLRQVEAMGGGAIRSSCSSRITARVPAVDRATGATSAAPPGSAQTHLGLGPGWASCSNAPFRLHKELGERGVASLRP
jgi:arylsulfatase